MSHSTFSRHIEPAELTLAAVIELISADPALGLRHKNDFGSALRSLCRVFGRAPAELVADPRALRRRMKEFGPTVTGLSPGRWRNIRSLSMSALKSMGINVTPARSSRPLSPAWRRVFELLPDRTFRFGIARFVRYCGEIGILPEAVDDGVMNGFGQMVMREGLCSRPKSAHRTACQTWNRAAATVPGWPRTMLAIPNHRRVVALPEATFPAAFIAEKDAFLRDLAGMDRLATGDRLARLGRRPRRAITVYNRRILTMQLVSALVHRGHAAEAVSMLYLVEHAEDALRYFLDRLPAGETSGQVFQLSVTLKLIGKFVRVGDALAERLRNYCRGLAPDDTGMSEKKRARLRQFDDPENLIKFLRVPDEVCRELSKKKGPPTMADAVAMQLAVALELIVVKPMRLATLAGIDYDKHVSRTRIERGGITHISAPAANVKNRVAFDAALPQPSAELLHVYLTRYRPLLDGDTQWLFPGTDGNPKRPGALGSQISRFIKRRTGFDVNPHLVRSIAAIIILNRNPGAYEDVRLVLGNKDLRIITKHYCGEETKAALRRYDEMVLGIRGQADQPQSKPTRSADRRSK